MILRRLYSAANQYQGRCHMENECQKQITYNTIRTHSKAATIYIMPHL